MRNATLDRALTFTALLSLSLAPAAVAAGETSGLLIADFDRDKIETVSALSLVALSDEQLGGTSEAGLTLVRPGARATAAALRVSFHVTDAFAKPFASVWAFVGAEGLATDLTAYRGLRFFARSAGGSFLAGIGQFSGQSIRSVAPFEVKPDWTLVELPFERFQRVPPAVPAAPLVAKDVTTIGFSVAPSQLGSFDLELDQLEIYK